MFSVSFLFAGEDAPVKRRPRIRVYDQKANVMPVMQPVDESGTEENDFDKKMRSEVGAPSQDGPLNMVSIFPTLNTSSPDTRPDAAEEDEDSWITPMDLLSEADQLEGEELDLSVQKEGEGEIEILDWEGLQKSMIEDAMKKTQPEVSEEELEEMLKGRTEDPIESPSTGGLEMEDVAPLQELTSEQTSLGESRFLEAGRDQGGFVPVLPSARQMNGEIYTPVRERNTQLELSGSQGMLNDLKEKWAKPTDRSVGQSSTNFEMPGMSRELNLPRVSAREVSIPSFSLNNPALSRQPLVQRPAILDPVRQDMPAQQPRIEPGAIRGNDYRLRSQLGVSSGL